MKIAVCEDEKSVREAIVRTIRHRFEEKGYPSPSVFPFSNGYDFLEAEEVFDVVFMDIQMPGISGMDTARKIREKDKDVILVFVTNLAQYAIKGYEVNAFDFILKPIDDAGFMMKLDRIMTEYQHLHENSYLTIKTKEGVIRIALEDLLYVEVNSHDLPFYTKGEEHTIRGALKDYVEILSSHYFSLCNKGYLVNLAHVREVNKTFAVLSDGTELIISKGKRKNFLEDLNKYLGGTI